MVKRLVSKTKASIGEQILRLRDDTGALFSEIAKKFGITVGEARRIYHAEEEKEVKTKPKVQLMLDSGAFSAWQKGEEINIDEYIAYVKENNHRLASYVNLDVIPGTPDRIRTAADVEASAKQSYKNLLYMHKHGLKPIPVFHRGERWYWLEKMLEMEEPYIGVSPSSYIVGTTTAMAWLDQVFTRLTDSGGQPIVKVHGFAVASFDLLKRYPWFTCDATSWTLTAAYGSIYVPVYKAGKADYTQAPVKLTVSEADRKNGEMPADHYLRYGPMMRERVEHFVTQEVGVTMEQAASSYEVRARAVVFFYQRFAEAIGEQPFKHRIREL